MKKPETNKQLDWFFSLTHPNIVLSCASFLSLPFFSFLPLSAVFFSNLCEVVLCGSCVLVVLWIPCPPSCSVPSAVVFRSTCFRLLCNEEKIEANFVPSFFHCRLPANNGRGTRIFWRLCEGPRLLPDQVLMRDGWLHPKRTAGCVQRFRWVRPICFVRGLGEGFWSIRAAQCAQFKIEMRLGYNLCNYGNWLHRMELWMVRSF